MARLTLRSAFAAVVVLFSLFTIMSAVTLLDPKGGGEARLAFNRLRERTAHSLHVFAETLEEEEEEEEENEEVTAAPRTADDSGVNEPKSSTTLRPTKPPLTRPARARPPMRPPTRSDLPPIGPQFTIKPGGDPMNTFDFNETPEEKASRLERYAFDQADVVSDRTFLVRSMPFVVENEDLIIRTAIPLSSTKLVMTTHRPRLDRRTSGMTEFMTKWTAKCEVLEEDEKVVANCRCESIGSRSDRVACDTTAPLDFNRPGASFTLRWGGVTDIVIEPPLVQSSGVHVCIQGVIWTDNLYGPMPLEHFETYVGHYARYGVTDIHMYTNSFRLVRDWFKSRRAKNTRVWFHDSPYPPMLHNATYYFPFDTQNRGLQYYSLNYFVMNDCITRAKSMGGAYALMVDLDEYVFPKIANATLQQALDRSEKVSPDCGLQMNSLMFHTGLCVTNRVTGKDPVWYHDFLNTFWVCKSDSTRDKIAVAVGGMSIDAVVNSDQLVHTFSGAPLTRATTVEVHHYREAWHKGVCGTVLRPGQSPPEGWHFLDPGPGVAYPPVDTVWMSDGDSSGK